MRVQEEPIVGGLIGGLLVSAVMVGVLYMYPIQDGKDGLRGEQGVAGLTGPQGERGARGDIGPTGVAGESGPQGDPGARGEQGSAGPQGLLGEKGEKGDSAFDRIPQHMLDATYAITTTRGRGAGYAVDPRHIHTCAHLFEGEITSITVTLRGKTQKEDVEVVAKLLAIDKLADLAFIETDKDLPAWAVEDFTGSYHEGDAVIIVGNPSAVGIVGTVGYIGSPVQAPEGYWPELLVSGAATWHGNSGGPVFDAKSGKVIGILVAGSGAPNVSLLVPISKFKGFFKHE